jgi:hypothetical protein
MKKPTTPEWLAMLVITICVGLGILALALATKPAPNLNKCPLCERPATYEF